MIEWKSYPPERATCMHCGYWTEGHWAGRDLYRHLKDVHQISTADLRRQWRSWAQFVYIGGGPVTMSNETLAVDEMLGPSTVSDAASSLKPIKGTS